MSAPISSSNGNGNGPRILPPQNPSATTITETSVHVGVETGGSSCRIGVARGADVLQFLKTGDADVFSKSVVSMQVPTDHPEGTIGRVGVCNVFSDRLSGKND